MSSQWISSGLCNENCMRWDILVSKDLKVVQQVSAGHCATREKVLGHPVILTLYLHRSDHSIYGTIKMPP